MDAVGLLFSRVGDAVNMSGALQGGAAAAIVRKVSEMGLKSKFPLEVSICRTAHH